MGFGRNRQKGDTFANGSQSWRELAEPRRLRVNSRTARKRRWLPMLRLLAILLTLALVVGGIYYLIQSLDINTKGSMAAAKGSPIESILFKTDGVLTEEWLRKKIGLQTGMPIMEVDIFALKKEIEETPQVEVVAVERIFPSSMRIEIIERKPLMRLMTVNASGAKRLRIVARDGTVYRGVGYSKNKLKALPYLQPYQDSDRGYLPLRGIERVVELFDLVSAAQAEFFGTWQVVSLRHFNGSTNFPGQVIEVRSSEVPKIIFSASKDFALQMDRLMFILNHFEKNNDPFPEQIDLSLRGAAAVRLKGGRAQVF